ncbi:uncharacterized protein LOC135125524 [Zophobas morio]|uniref:uncharacterized protein LOC135125524 n=1 Tax=Zophobas morio TaxID=2755281 RepID=UPI0030837127
MLRCFKEKRNIVCRSYETLAVPTGKTSLTSACVTLPVHIEQYLTDIADHPNNFITNRKNRVVYSKLYTEMVILLRILGIYVITAYVTQAKVVKRNSENELSPTQLKILFRELEMQSQTETASRKYEFPKLEEIYISPETNINDTSLRLTAWGIISICFYFFFGLNLCCLVCRWKFCRKHNVRVNVNNVSEIAENPVATAQTNEVPVTPPPCYESVVVDPLPTYEELMEKRTNATCS